VVDVGASRDLIASLAEGLRVHLDEVARFVPRANPRGPDRRTGSAVGPGRTTAHRLRFRPDRRDRPDGRGRRTA
jgi:hypothetical protein